MTEPVQGRDAHGRLATAEGLSRFWARVRKTETCWLWTGTRVRRGYGRMSYRGRYEYAHRLALHFAGREIPEGMQVCHHCDNPPCVNPAHLFIGSARDNLLDAVRKGRVNNYRPGPGDQNKMALLTWPQVRAIRHRVGEGEPRKRVAQAFGVSVATVHDIIRGRSWREEAM